MTSTTNQSNPIQRLGNWTADQAENAEQLERLYEDLHNCVGLAQSRQLSDTAATIELLAEVVASILWQANEQQQPPGQDPRACDFLQYLQDQLPPVIASLDAEADRQSLSPLAEEIVERWGDWLESDRLISSRFSETCESAYATAPAAGDRDFETQVEPAAAQIDLLLSVLQQEAGAQPEPPKAITSENTQADNAPSDPPADPTWNPSPDHSEIELDDELRLAFLDDANRCLIEMEQVVLEAGQRSDRERLRSFCRELHTLKGASASVGLSPLAQSLHQLEEKLEAQHGQADSGSMMVDEDQLLAAVDTVRAQIQRLESPQNSASNASADPPPSQPQQDPELLSPSADGSPTEARRPAWEASGQRQPTNAGKAVDAPTASPTTPTRSDFSGANYSGSGNGTSVRVRASQLDRLMDLLADLVALRNQRETAIGGVILQRQELARCAARLRRFQDQHQDHLRCLQRASAEGSRKLGVEPTSSAALAEIAHDISEVSRRLEDVSAPVQDVNQSLSQFIRLFRQELMQLRRLPVSGLFQRLTRSVRDAARCEGKQVTVCPVGGEIGVEQTVQEKLFDPLLHMVRNSVSHGIETPDERVRAGKSPQGKITLSATANSNALIVTIGDDGRGLNYDAIRKRGCERGLLSPAVNPDRKQLARLIFHAGFSTREAASSVSGRGIGMDVVATTLERMHGRIDVDSEPGQGTTMTITVPLATGIEHAMIFRAGDCSFALPMRAIRSAEKSWNPADRLVPLPTCLWPDQPWQPVAPQAIYLDECFGLAVDEILGPEEVVVRPLPGLLARHPLITGAVRAGSGQTVLMLAAENVAEFCRNRLQTSPHNPGFEFPSQSNTLASDRETIDALIVDDSLSARKIMARRLNEFGLTTLEARDGIDALNQLNQRQFKLVFTDLDMPGMDGLELLSEIQLRHMTDAPRIVVSSRPRDEIWSRLADQGASEFMQKPVTDALIRQVLDNYLNKPNHTEGVEHD